MREYLWSQCQASVAIILKWALRWFISGLFEYDFLQPSSIYTDDFNDFGGVVAIDSQNSQVLNNNTNQPPEIISLTVSNAVGGTVNPLGTVIYYGASAVTLEADAELGYLFSSWVDENNNLFSTDNPFLR